MVYYGLLLGKTMSCTKSFKTSQTFKITFIVTYAN